MRNTIEALAFVAAGLAGAGCDEKPDKITPDSSAKEVIAANRDCNDDFDACSADSEIKCLMEWDECMQEIREACAEVSGSFLDNPLLDVDGDGAEDVSEAALALKSFCHADANPFTCATVPDQRCDDYNVLGVSHLIPTLHRFFEKQNGSRGENGNIGE